MSDNFRFFTDTVDSEVPEKKQFTKNQPTSQVKTDYLNHGRTEYITDTSNPHRISQQRQHSHSLQGCTKVIPRNANRDQLQNNSVIAKPSNRPSSTSQSNNNKNNSLQMNQFPPFNHQIQTHSISTYSCEKENNYIPNLPHPLTQVPAKQAFKPQSIIYQQHHTYQPIVLTASSTQFVLQEHQEITQNNHKAQPSPIAREDHEEAILQAIPLDSPQFDSSQQDATPMHLNFKEENIQHLLQTEGNHCAHGGYMGTVQKEINERMRGILLDWLVEVHFKLKLQTETLFMAVNLTDRYLERVHLESSRLQLLGITALFVASKYEEVYAVPHVKDLVYVCDNAYTAEDIFTMEGSLLLTLNFNILSVSSFRLLDYFALYEQDLGEKNYFLARYLIEIALLEYQLISNPPSLIAAAAIYLVNKIRKRAVSWNADLAKISGYSEAAVRPCAKQICYVVQSIDGRKYLASLKKKFSKGQFFEVAKIKIEHKKENTKSIKSSDNATKQPYNNGQNGIANDNYNHVQEQQQELRQDSTENQETLEQVEFVDIDISANAARLILENRMFNLKDRLSTSGYAFLVNKLCAQGVRTLQLQIDSETIVSLLEKKLGTSSNKQLWQLPVALARIVINTMFQQDQLELSHCMATPRLAEILIDSLLSEQS